MRLANSAKNMTQILHPLTKALLLGVLTLGSVIHGQEAAPMTEEEKKVERALASIQWQTEGNGQLGDHSTVTIPAGHKFTTSAGAKTLLRLSGNIPSNRELGLLCTEELDNWVIFEFDPSGYVKDDDKDALDADAMIASLREGQEMANEERKRQGLDELEVTGWAMPPKYNETTHNLEWAPIIRSKSDGGVSVNYNTRLLGREGVMEVTLLCSPDELQAVLPTYQTILAGHAYVAGKTYAEYRQGDKLAEYGLAALVVGGAAVGAAKLGWLGKLGVLFAKLGKAAFLVVAGIAISIKKLFSKLFSRAQ